MFEEKIPVRFELILDARVERDLALGVDNLARRKVLAYQVLMLFCGTSQRETSSQAYRTCLSKIAALNTESPERDNRADITIPVYVNFSMGFAQVTELFDCMRAETEIKEQWRGYSEQPLAAGDFRCTFKVAPMIAEFQSTIATDPDISGALLAMMRGNVAVAHVGLALDMDFVDGAPIDQGPFAHVMRSVTANDRHPMAPSSQSSRSLQVESMHLSCYPSLPKLGLEMLFSSIAHTQSTRKLTIDLRFWEPEHYTADRSLWWKWIAYGLFSRRAQTHSAVEELSIRAISTLREADAEGFAAVLKSEHPEEYLFGMPRGQIDTREATINASAPVHWQRVDQRGSTEVLLFDEPVHCVWTLSDDGESEWVSVLVPGHGKCQVQRCSLTFPARTTGVDSGLNELRSLTIEFDDNRVPDTSGFARFLAAIGPRLKYLTICKGKAEFDDNIVLQCCPALDELVLYDGAVDVRLNFAEFHQSKRKLPRLTYNWEDLAASLADFADLSNPLSRCLRKLRVHLYHDVPANQRTNYQCRPEKDVLALLKLLDTNRTLEYLEVVAPPQYTSYLGAFRKFHLQPTWIPFKPLPRGAKAALLSVVAVREDFPGKSTKKLKRESSRSNACVHELDQLVLSEILGFAADPAMRRVYFHTELVPEDRRFFQMGI